MIISEYNAYEGNMEISYEGDDPMFKDSDCVFRIAFNDMPKDPLEGNTSAVIYLELADLRNFGQALLDAYNIYSSKLNK